MADGFLMKSSPFYWKFKSPNEKRKELKKKYFWIQRFIRIYQP